MAFVDDLSAPVLGEADRHHLERVLRLRAGDELTLADGVGRWCSARFGPDLETIGPTLEVPPARPAITVGFALVKGQRPELVVQKLTELGVDRIVPLRAARSVVRWDGAGKATAAVDRLRLVARAAAMQSHRPRLPEVTEVTDVATLAAEPGAALAERGGARPTLDHPVVLVGPEGGWDPRERAASSTTVALGDLVLRAETAAIAAGTVLAALRHGLVTEGG